MDFDFAKVAMEAIKSGNWWVVASLALVLVTTGARKWLAPRVSWLSDGPGAALLVLVGSFGGALLTAFLAGSAPSWGLFLTAMKVAAGASGGYGLVRAVAGPLLQKWAAGSGWKAALASALLWVLNKPSAIAAAEKAGDDAVAANPPGGLKDLTGEPDEVP